MLLEKDTHLQKLKDSVPALNTTEPAGKSPSACLFEEQLRLRVMMPCAKRAQCADHVLSSGCRCGHGNFQRQGSPLHTTKCPQKGTFIFSNPPHEVGTPMPFS